MYISERTKNTNYKQCTYAKQCACSSNNNACKPNIKNLNPSFWSGAIISENLLNLLQSKNHEDRQKLLKVHKCYFANWINDIFRVNKNEVSKYTVDDIIEDIEHFYEIDRVMPSKGVDDVDLEIFRKICDWCLKKTQNYTVDIIRQDGKGNYISTPFFHKRQISQLANKKVKLNEKSDLEKIQWERVDYEKYVLSSLQYKLYGEELYGIISKN